MPELDISKTTILERNLQDYSVPSQNLDVHGDQDETFWDYPNAQKNMGYYKTIPELKKAIDALAVWTTGKGYETDQDTRAILEHITGNGKDTFKNIIWNMQVMKKAVGDSFAEIIIDKDSELLINLKPLSAERMRSVYGRNGILKRYEYKNKTGKGFKTFKPNEIFHLQNDRVGDEIHGISVIEACKWVIDARNEAMTDYRKVLHRNVIPVRIIEVDTDNTTKRDALMAEYKDAINKGEVLVVPKGVVEFKNDQITIQDPTTWIQYLENFFYQAVGIPRVIANSEGFTEASSKVGYLTFEPVYTNEQTELEEDLWAQLQIRISFNRPPSLKENMQSDEAKNTGQLGFQANDVTAGAGV
jgi:hypothetical protein